MTDVTQHLGELMGRSDAELLADQKAAAASRLAEMQAPESAPAAAPDIAQGVAGAAPSPALVEAHPAAAPAIQVPDVASQAASNHALEQYAFPFQSHEVFGLLPHSIGAKAEGLWQLANSLAGNTSALSIAVGGLLIGVVAVAAVSTVRVWRRGDEVAVAGFGDRLTKVGSRYTVRQDAPVAAFADKPGVVRRAEKSPSAPAPETTAPSVAVVPAPKGNTWRERREAQAAKTNPAPVKPPEPAPIKAEKQTPASQPVQPAKAERASSTNGKGKEPKAKDVKEREPPPPLVAADESKRPKIVKRQLFKRSATTVNYAGSFHGSYGSFQQTDRLFARDYLKQTNEAFELAYLKGKGPNLAELKVGDNHRAERLFMMATRASFEDPQAALAALWQAVDEDRTDAVAWLRLAHFYLELGEFDHARRILEPLQLNAERLGLDIIVAAAANSLAKVAAQRGEIEPARKLFAKSLSHAEKTDNPFMLGVASSNFGLLEASRKKLDTARTLLQRGIKGFETCDERISAARTKLALGVVQASLGDEEEATRLWGEAAETFRSAGFEDDAAQAARWQNGEGTPNAIIL